MAEAQILDGFKEQRAEMMNAGGAAETYTPEVIGEEVKELNKEA